MVKLIALFKKPADPADFDQKYFETHLPLARQMPGLRRMEVARVVDGAMGPTDNYIITELYFDDLASLQASMASPEGKAGGKNLMGFARDLVSWMVAEVQD